MLKQFKRFKKFPVVYPPGILIFFLLLQEPTYAQSSARLFGALQNISLSVNTEISISRYNGYSYVAYETVPVLSDGKFNFTKELPEGFYQLNIPVQKIMRIFYSTGKTDIEVTVRNSQFEADKVQFNDEENKAFTELQAASRGLEISLNTLNEKFDPRQLDSFYYQKIGPYNIKVMQVYKEFNAGIQILKAKYKNTVVMNLFSSYYKLPLFDEDKVNGLYYDNQDAYWRDHFFDLWKTDDERIIRLPEVKLKLEKYFRFFARKNHSFLIKKCDEITALAKNERVKKYLASLLIDFFTQVKENDMVAYMVETNLHGCLDDIDVSLINFNQNNLRGTKVSALELPAENGQPVNLAMVYNKAKITVLYFWSPDCIHCQNFHPAVKNLKEKYGKDLEVYSVCLEDDNTKWKAAILQFELTFNNVIASGEQRKQVRQLFNIRYTPSVYLLNKAGEVVDKDLTVDDINEALRKSFQ